MDAHPIPPMIHPLSRHWDQPPREDVLVDDTHALMTARTFVALAEYSATTPSGVYEGKMWKRNNGVHERVSRGLRPEPEWLLCWYGPGAIPDSCSINWRRILLVR